MRVPTRNYQIASVQRTQRPIYIVHVITKTKSFSITTTATSISGTPGDRVFMGRVDTKGINSTSQTLQIEKGNSTVGGFSFTAVDVDKEISAYLRNLYLEVDSINAARVVVYRGFVDLAFPDYLQLGAFVIDSVEQKPNQIKFKCSDPTRYASGKIFEAVEGSLFDPLPANFKTGWRRLVGDVGDLALITYDHALNDEFAGKVLGFIKLGSGDETEIVQFNQVDEVGRRVHISGRGLFNTPPQDWKGYEVDPDTQEQEAGEDFTEWFYLRMNAVKLAYALFTGEFLGNITDRLPAKCHAGITSDFISANSFINIGLDLYDPQNSKHGPILEFFDLEATSADALNNVEIAAPIGLYMFSNTRGEIELRRDPLAFPGMGGGMLIDERNIISVGSIKRDPKRVRNIVNIKYAIDWKTKDYTRSNSYIFSQSIAQYGRTEPKTLKFKGVNVNYALDPLLRRINQVCVDRYSEEVVTVQVKTLPSTHLVEVGDVIYLDANQLPDWGGNSAQLTRSMIITKSAVNWITGEVSLTLESMIKPPRDLGPQGSPAFTDNFYTQGNNITTRLTPGTFRVSGATLFIESDSNLNGFDNIHTNASVWGGDIIIERAATLTVTKNVQIRALGSISIQGKIIGMGKAYPAWSAPVSGDHYVGPGLIYSQAGVRAFFGDDANEVPEAVERAIQDAGTPTARRLDISVTGIDDTNFTKMIPKSIRGGNGPVGGDSIAIDWAMGNVPPAGTPRTVKGSNGGIGGSGLLLVARNGFIRGLDSVIDLSGSSSVPASREAANATYLRNGTERQIAVDVLAGSGGGGGAGCCLCITESSITDDLSPSFVSKYGLVSSVGESYVGTVAGEMTANDFNNGDMLHGYELGMPGNKARDFSGAAFAMYLVSKTEIVNKPTTKIPEELKRLDAYVLGNTPPTADQSRATIVVNAVPADNDPNYRYSQFSYKQEGSTSWRPLQNVTSSETRLEVGADGMTWDFLAVPTNVEGHINPVGAEASATAPTNSVDRVTVQDVSVSNINVSVVPVTGRVSWVPVGVDKFPNGAIIYEVQHRIGTNGIFNAVGSTTETSLDFAGIVDGLNTVRVRAVPPNGLISNWASLNFNATIAATPTSPTFTPVTDSAYWGVFSWIGNSPIFEVNVTGPGNVLAFSMTTTSNECFIPSFDPGEYVFKVRGVSGDKVSLWATTRAAVGGIVAPTNIAFAWQPNNAVSAGVLSWSNSDSRVSGFEVDIKTADGLAVASLAANSLSTPLPFLIPGEYSARVRSLWRTFASTWASLNISISVDAKDPTDLVFTRDNIPGSSGVLTWTGSENYYDVRIENDKEQPVIETGVGSETYRVGLLASGSYTAYIRSQGTFGSSGWSSLGFSISAPSKPLQLTFDPNSDIYGQDGVLTWLNPPELISGYRVDIVTTADAIIISDKTTATNYALAGFPSGDYRARVYSLAPIGDAISGPALVDFSITELVAPRSMSAVEKLTQTGSGWVSSAVVNWVRGDNRTETYDLEYRPLNSPSWIGGGSGATTSATVTNLSFGEYVFRVRAKFGGLNSGWTEATVSIAGYNKPPPNITGFQVRALSGQFAMLTWDNINDIEVTGGGNIQVRHTYKTDASATWEAASALTEMLPGNATFVSVPLLEGTYLIKAGSVRGLWSDQASATKSNMNSMGGYTRIESIDEPPGWLGLKNKATVDSSGDLKFYDVGGNDEAPFYIMKNPLDLGAVYTVRLSLDVDGSAFIEDMIDDRLDPIDTWKAFDGAAPGGLSLRYDVSTTEQDPASGSATWSEWKQFLVGEFRARGFKIRVSLWNSFDFAGGGLANLRLMADVPERTESGGLPMTAGYRKVNYAIPFMRNPSLNATIQNMIAGDHIKINNPTETGFEIRVYDAGGFDRPTAFVDWIAAGYGTKEV